MAIEMYMVLSFRTVSRLLRKTGEAVNLSVKKKSVREI
jgi:hypothetical protein